MNEHRLKRAVATGIVAVAAACGLAPAADARPKEPIVPPAIKVQDGNELFLVGHAVGVQIYSCTAAATGPAWTFVAPRATLVDDRGKTIINHFAGPTWQHRDGSQVVGRLDGTATVDPTAIPWLRLAAASTAPGQFGDTLAGTTFIQRINTRGGIAPAAALCNDKAVGTQVEVPYTADYTFWEKRCPRGHDPKDREDA